MACASLCDEAVDCTDDSVWSCTVAPCDRLHSHDGDSDHECEHSWIHVDLVVSASAAVEDGVWAAGVLIGALSVDEGGDPCVLHVVVGSDLVWAHHPGELASWFEHCGCGTGYCPPDVCEVYVVVSGGHYRILPRVAACGDDDLCCLLLYWLSDVPRVVWGHWWCFDTAIMTVRKETGELVLSDK